MSGKHTVSMLYCSNEWIIAQAEWSVLNHRCVIVHFKVFSPLDQRRLEILITNQIHHGLVVSCILELHVIVKLQLYLIKSH